jgi:transposase
LSRWRIGLEAYGTCFSPLLIGGGKMSLKGGFDCFVGVDISKDKFDACGITGEEVKLFQFSAAMDRKGFEKLKGHLAAVSISSVLIGMESTASYHVNLVHMAGIFTKSILKLLQQYPSAFTLRDANLGQLSQMLIADSYGHKREAFAAELIKAAHLSIGSKSPAKDMILKQKIALLRHLEDALQEITGMLIEMSRKLMEEEINLMISLKGIGEKAAANFLIEMGGDINQFDRSGKIIAMAGLDPAVYQSGKHDGKGRITKRGNRHLRKIIWLMTTKVIQYTDVFSVYYLKRRKEGLPYKMAVLATAHKLIRVIYAMLTQRKTFCPQVNS